MTGLPIFPNEVFLNVLDLFIYEWVRVREPLYQSYPVAVSGYAQTTKRQLCTLSRVNHYFRCVLLPHIFHTIVFRGSHFVFDPNPYDYRQLCKELLEGQTRAVAIAALVKECIFTTWNSGIIGETAWSKHRVSLQDRMEQDLQAIELMQNLRVVRFNNAVVPFTSLARTLRKLPHVEAICLGELDPSNEPGPLIQAMRNAPVLTDLTIHEINLVYLTQMPLPRVKTLRTPFLRDLNFARSLFQALPFLPSLTALYIHSHWADLSSLLHDTDPPLLQLEHLTCPIELAPLLVPERPLHTVALRVPNLYDNNANSRNRLFEFVAALESITGQLVELEIPHSICLVEKWLFKVPVLDLCKLTISILSLPAADCKKTYSTLCNQFEQRPLTKLNTLEMHILNHQLDFPFQRDLIRRLLIPFPSLERVCFSEYVAWYREPNGDWVPEKTIDPGEPLSWFRDHNGDEYVMSFLTTKEVLVGDQRGLFSKGSWAATHGFSIAQSA